MSFACPDCEGDTFPDTRRFNIPYGQYPDQVTLSAMGPCRVCAACGAAWSTPGSDEAERTLIQDYLATRHPPHSGG